MSYVEDELELATQAVREHGEWSQKWAPDAPRCIADDVLSAVAPAVAARALRDAASRITDFLGVEVPEYRIVVGLLETYADEYADEIERGSDD